MRPFFIASDLWSILLPALSTPLLRATACDPVSARVPPSLWVMGSVPYNHCILCAEVQSNNRHFLAKILEIPRMRAKCLLLVQSALFDEVVVWGGRVSGGGVCVCVVGWGGVSGRLKESLRWWGVSS